LRLRSKCGYCLPMSAQISRSPFVDW
jgi:hypothetical protein